MTVMQFSQTKAVSIMLEAHQTGKGQVIVCSSEEYAEAHSDNLNSRGLTTTVEPMEVG
jgi:ATP-dependent Clp protease adaptor protein ClpS